MTDQQVVLQQARRSLLVMGAACILGLLLYFGSLWVRDAAQTQAAQAQGQASSAQAVLTEKQTDLKQLQADIERFMVLKRQGLVGRPDRAVWLEQLTASRLRLALPDSMSYTLQSPKPLAQQDAASPGSPGVPDAASGASGGGAGANGESGQGLFHDLELTFANVHEEELLGLLRDYQAQVAGRMRVNACHLDGRTATGLTARCALRFFTVPEAAPAATAQ